MRGQEKAKENAMEKWKGRKREEKIGSDREARERRKGRWKK